MNIPEGENLGVTGYKLSYKDGSTVVIDREPTEFEARECLIEPIMIDRAAPTPPAQDDEPVASLYVSRFRGHLENTQFEYLGDLPDGTYKLYTRPDNSGLRKAAGELLKQLDWACDIKFSGHENSKAYYKAARELRVSLEGK